MKITIVGKNVGEKPVEENLEHTLENMQKRVREDGATLDVVRLTEDIIMWVDDEGLLNNSLPNFVITDNAEIIAQIHGNVFFTGTDEVGETVGLNLKQMTSIEKCFKELELEIADKNGENYSLYAFKTEKLKTLLKE